MAYAQKIVTTSGPRTSTESAEWMPDAPLMLSIKQTAALLGVSQGTVKNLLARGELVRRKVGALTRIPRTSVESFVKRDHATL
jgi:excisionase family DNA binding protein